MILLIKSASHQLLLYQLCVFLVVSMLCHDDVQALHQEKPKLCPLLKRTFSSDIILISPCLTTSLMYQVPGIDQGEGFAEQPVG